MLQVYWSGDSRDIEDRYPNRDRKECCLGALTLVIMEAGKSHQGLPECWRAWVLVFRPT